MGGSRITARPWCATPRPRAKKTPRQKHKEAEEEDAKKTRYIFLVEENPTEEDSIFTPAESPHFQNAADNGGIGGQISSNRPLRGAKFTPYEGGIRTPFTARWPDRLPAGKVYGGAVSMVDVLPTALPAATGKAPEAADGVDLVPCLTGERQGSPHETLVWWGVIGKDQPWVVRHGRWKLIGKGEEPAELYDLVEDMEEKNNRFSQNPEIAKDLVTRLKAWRQAGDEKASKRPAKK